MQRITAFSRIGHCWVVFGCSAIRTIPGRGIPKESESMLRNRGAFSARCIGLFAFLLPLVLQTGCKRSGSSSSFQSETAAPAGSLELVFSYGSEKESWIKDVTDSFNRAGNKTSSG